MGSEIFTTIVDSDKSCFYGKIQTDLKSYDFGQSRHMSLKISKDNFHPPIKFKMQAKKPYIQFGASVDIYNTLMQAYNADAPITMTSLLKLKSKSQKIAAEASYTLIVNSSHLNNQFTVTTKTHETLPKLSPSNKKLKVTFAKDVTPKYNPARNLSQELSKLSSPQRVKLNYHLTPKSKVKLLDSLSSEIFHDSSSDNDDIFDSEHKKNHKNKKIDSEKFDSLNDDFIDDKDNNNSHVADQSKAQQESNELHVKTELPSEKPIERITTPERKNLQTRLTVEQDEVRKPVSWKKGNKPGFMKEDSESSKFSSNKHKSDSIFKPKLPSLSDHSSSTVMVEPLETNLGKIKSDSDSNSSHKSQNHNENKPNNVEDKPKEDSSHDSFASFHFEKVPSENDKSKHKSDSDSKKLDHDNDSVQKQDKTNDENQSLFKDPVPPPPQSSSPPKISPIFDLLKAHPTPSPIHLEPMEIHKPETDNHQNSTSNKDNEENKTESESKKLENQDKQNEETLKLSEDNKSESDHPKSDTKERDESSERIDEELILSETINSDDKKKETEKSESSDKKIDSDDNKSKKSDSEDNKSKKSESSDKKSDSEDNKSKKSDSVVESLSDDGFIDILSSSSDKHKSDSTRSYSKQSDSSSHHSHKSGNDDKKSDSAKKNDDDEEDSDEYF